MKLKPFAVALLLFLSCNEHPQPTQNKTQHTPIRKDSVVAQQSANPYSPIDISPVDISYFPDDYPVDKMLHKTTSMPLARVIYSRPHRQGRNIFGGLLKYGEPWRLGANEATEIEFFEPVTIQDKKIPAGRYVIYCIPQADSWTVIINSNIYSWGLKQDRKQDLYQFNIPVGVVTTPLEYFSMVFEKTDTGANLLMAWDVVVARLPIFFK